ncbi:MAG: zinc ribbon domain-containing protein [Desulfobaccales bacterium]
MWMSFCSNCGKNTGHQRRLGWGTFFAVLLTAGFWLLALPLYPQRCILCGKTSSSAPSDQIKPTIIGKQCPQCAEIVKIEAKKCRFCGEVFAPSLPKK